MAGGGCSIGAFWAIFRSEYWFNDGTTRRPKAKGQARRQNCGASVSISKDGYYLIFCILLGNVGVNTAMSILLGNMTNGVVGGLIATLLITMFGEILPQAIFSQRGYRFVRYFFWLLDVIYVLFWPLAQPMSKLLNRWLGKETPQLYSHQELEEIIHEHAVRSDSPVDYDEVESRRVRCSLVKRRLAIWLRQ